MSASELVTAWRPRRLSTRFLRSELGLIFVRRRNLAGLAVLVSRVVLTGVDLAFACAALLLMRRIRRAEVAAPLPVDEPALPPPGVDGPPGCPCPCPYPR